MYSGHNGNSQRDIPTSWHELAVCKPEHDAILFPTHNLGRPKVEIDPYADARELCASCPVRTQCATFAMKMEDKLPLSLRHGMWGGLSPQERNALDKGERVRRKPAARPMGSSCPNGHVRTPETVIVENGVKRCVICRREANERSRAGDTNAKAAARMRTMRDRRRREEAAAS